MLFRLPFSALPDDHRDRVDMAVERMMPEDLELLTRISEMQAGPRRDPAENESLRYLFGDCNVVSLTLGSTRRVATTMEWTFPGFSKDVFRQV